MSKLRAWAGRVLRTACWLSSPFIVVWAITRLLPPEFRFQVSGRSLLVQSFLVVALTVWWTTTTDTAAAERAQRERLRLQKAVDLLIAVVDGGDGALTAEESESNN